MYRGGSTDPWARSFDPALARQRGIPFSTLVRDMAPIRRVLLPVLAQLATGCSNPLFITIAIITKDKCKPQVCDSDINHQYVIGLPPNNVSSQCVDPTRSTKHIF